VVLGDLFEQSGRIDEAIAIFARVIEINPHLYLPYYYYGKLASKEGGKRIGEAIEKLQKAVALDPTFADAHYELRKALAQAGRPEEAVRELKRSLDLNPSLAEAHYQLGLVYKKLGDQTRSAEQLRLFQATNREESAGDLIQRLEVQIEKK
jgi:tetratricopeptide (TPR) repeat protein